MSSSFSGCLSYFYFTLFNFCVLRSGMVNKYDDDDICSRAFLEPQVPMIRASYLRSCQSPGLGWRCRDKSCTSSFADEITFEV